ncbi:hypothetical protein ACLBXM_12760 [Xanthobacteraceae bacterium A53D]
MPTHKPRTRRELCTIDADGHVSDEALHDEILDNAEAERAVAQQAVQRAIRDQKLTPEQAEELYGYKG